MTFVFQLFCSCVGGDLFLDQEILTLNKIQGTASFMIDLLLTWLLNPRVIQHLIPVEGSLFILCCLGSRGITCSESISTSIVMISWVVDICIM